MGWVAAGTEAVFREEIGLKEILLSHSATNALHPSIELRMSGCKNNSDLKSLNKQQLTDVKCTSLATIFTL
jgi:hypothetical protein